MHSSGLWRDWHLRTDHLPCWRYQGSKDWAVPLVKMHWDSVVTVVAAGRSTVAAAVVEWRIVVAQAFDLLVLVDRSSAGARLVRTVFPPLHPAALPFDLVATAAC